MNMKFIKFFCLIIFISSIHPLFSDITTVNGKFVSASFDTDENITIVKNGLFTYITTSSCSNAERVIGSGNIKTEKRDVYAFNSISFSGPGEIVLTQKENESLSIEAEDNILPYIETKIINNELQVNFKPQSCLATQAPIKYFLSIKDIDNINLSGSVSLNSELLKLNKLDINTSGQTQINAQLEANGLKIVSSGINNICILGKVDAEELILSGIARFDLSNLKAKVTSIDASGQSNIKLNAEEAITGSLSGMSYLSYTGNAKISVDKSGESDIEHR